MPIQQVIIFVAIIGAFYFLAIRPQQQAAKKQAEMVQHLEPGTEILTIGGIYATVVSTDDDRIRVALADGSQMELAKRAINSVIPPAVDNDDHDDGDVAETDAIDDVDPTAPEGDAL
jgi:preprotein translocase subunit YajC